MVNNVRWPRFVLSLQLDEENRALFAAGAGALDRGRSGLYREFHLKVAYLLDKKGWTLQQVFANPPDEAELDARLRDPG